jgi:DNA-binding HxlR family transcriptional regulator
VAVFIPCADLCKQKCINIAGVLGSGEMREAVARHLKRFASEVTRGLGIPASCAGIIEVLARAGRRLTFAELARMVRLSERSLRSHLRTLVARGILLRQVSVTRTRRLAYEYYIAPLGDILRIVRRDLRARIARLHRLSDEVLQARRAVPV